MRTKTFGSIRFIVSGIFILLTITMGFGIQTADCKTRIVVAQGVEPTKLDPDMHREQTTENVILHLYDALLERDRDSSIKPDLAESWKIINDTTVEFKLREGVSFSNGEPFNAAVVKYNFERVAGLMPDAWLVVRSANSLLNACESFLISI